jgi:protein-tyrosine-phosphatase
VPDRLLHAARRRAAFVALAAHQPLRSVLVVCNGNIFRSPFAAAVLKRALGPVGVAVDSAGFIGPGRPSPTDAVVAAARRGVDLRGHRSQLLVPELVRAADVILVMDMAQRRTISERFGRPPQDVLLLGDFDPAPIESRAIEDPVEQGPDVCEAVYARIEDCVGALVRGLRSVAMR